MAQSGGPSVLVTSIGIRPYEEAAWTLRGTNLPPVVTAYPSVALARLSPDLAGAIALVLVTKEAREQALPAFSRALEEASLKVQAVDIPSATEVEQIYRMFARLLDAVPGGARVSFDITFALRHLPFVVFCSLRYLAALSDVVIDRVFYGALDAAASDGSRPIVDLAPLLGLTDWAEAIGGARRHGDLRRVAEVVRTDVGALFKAKEADRNLSTVGDRLRALASSLACGLPLEVGLDSRRLVEALATLEPTGHPASTAARRAVQDLRGLADGWAVASGTSEKKSLVLERDELERQLRLARWYVDRGNGHQALLMLREWVINWALWVQDRCAGWLDYPARKSVEDALHTLSWKGKQGVATGGERDLGSFWAELTAGRDKLAHVGHGAEAAGSSAGKLQELLKRCEELLERRSYPCGAGAREGRLLVTPLGLSSGLLYTALHRLEPKSLLVVTSAEAAVAVPDVLKKAGRVDVEPHVFEVDDPFVAFGDHERLLEQRECRELLADAGEIVVNVTGGTTALQYLVQRVAERAIGLGATVRRAALVDRRPAEQQRAEPYVLGEVIWLDQPTERSEPRAS
ncbi:MAG: hypothetical protein HY815_32575 [Candidatus Riflebacteria bacterium]|nr:hypothetical protein [Candidatus Riflebacteria bacterium]